MSDDSGFARAFPAGCLRYAHLVLEVIMVPWDLSRSVLGERAATAPRCRLGVRS